MDTDEEDKPGVSYSFFFCILQAGSFRVDEERVADSLPSLLFSPFQMAKD